MPSGSAHRRIACTSRLARPGSFDVVDGSTLSLVEEVTTEEGAHTTAYNSQRRRLNVFLPGSCQARVYQESTAMSQ